VVWAKNAENELVNVNGKIHIEYLCDWKSILMWISKNDTAETAYRFFYDAEKKGVKIIRYTNVNTRYESNDYIIAEEYFLSGTKKLTKVIVARLNADFQTNGRYDNLNSVELFVKNNKENIARCMWKELFGKIRSDYIYINKEELMKSIEREQGYFIETIIIKRKKAHKIVEVDSSGCG